VVNYSVLLTGHQQLEEQLKNLQKGFTLIELMIVIAIVGVVFYGIIYYGLIVVGGMGNFWGSEAKILSCVQQVDESVVEVNYLDRRVTDLSVVTVVDEWGNKLTYYVDTNILQNCTAYSDPDGETRDVLHPERFEQEPVDESGAEPAPTAEIPMPSM